MAQFAKLPGWSPLTALAASGTLFLASACLLAGVYWKPRALAVDAFGVKDSALLIAERAIERGKVRIGDRVRCTFHLFNRSGETKHVTNVRPGCSCTKVSGFSRDIAPRSWGEVTVDVDTTGKPGTRTSSVLIETDDPKRPRLNPLVSCWVLPAVETKPERLRFVAEGPTGGFRPQTVQVAGLYDGEKVEIGHVVPSDPMVSVSGPTRTEDGHPRFDVAVDKGIAAGTTLAHLTVYIKGSAQEKIWFPVKVTNERRMKSEPAILTLSPVSGAPQAAEFTVKVVGDGALEVAKVELPGESPQVVQQRVAANAVTVRLTDLKATNVLNGKHISVLTNHGELRVPVVVSARTSD